MQPDSLSLSDTKRFLHTSKTLCLISILSSIMPIDSPLDPTLLEALTAVAWRAAEAILGFAAAPVHRVKADGSPVTAADEAAETLILEALHHLLPGVPVISEEAAARGEYPPLASTFVLVDPLDGTREFLAGRPEYTVNIAVVARETPVLGIIAAPPLGLIWRGVVGKGAERLKPRAGAQPDDGTMPIAIHPRRAPSGGLVAALSRSYPDPSTNAFIGRLPVSQLLTCGSSLKFCWLAEGAADVYPRLEPPMEWDIAAGHAILAAAGGIVIQPDGTPLHYGRADKGFRAPAFIAWGDPEAVERYRP